MRTRQVAYSKTDKGKACPKRWRDKNKNILREKRRLYVDANREQINATKRAWTKKNRDKVNEFDRARHRERHLRKKYGLSLDQFERLLKTQKYCCEICREPLDGKRIAVDHCHMTGYVRSLLCLSCNSAIGFLKHSDKIAVAAAHYLSKEVLFNHG
jgi:hypothetical protein